jgi:NADPH:quinone reductase-like Zn-dependent oxidoreductase
MMEQLSGQATPLHERPELQEAVVLRAFGGPERFELHRQPMPTAERGEVRVRVLAACVQFTDVIIRQGRYPGLGQKPPLVLGYDVIGEIDRVGPGDVAFRVGDRVAALTVTGSYTRYRTLAATEIVRVPPGVDPAEAATLVLSWTTAYQLLHREARVKAGQRVLVRGAAGAVGQALVSLGKLAGLEVWGTARREQAELVRSCGATPIDVALKTPHDIVPGGFDVVFDGIGERAFADSWACVKPGGMLCAFGFSDAIRRGESFLALGAAMLRLRLWNAFGHARAQFYSVTDMRHAHPDWFRADLTALFDLLSKGSIAPHVAERIGLADVAAAHRRVEAGHLGGKIVICP